MVFSRFLFDIVEELSLKQEDWFYAKDIRPQAEKRFGKPTTSHRVAKHLIPLCERGLLEAEKQYPRSEGPLKRYRVSPQYVGGV